jgi:hypothetical protein
MILANHTLSFAPEIEKEAITWIHDEFKPLVASCPHTSEVLFCRLTSDSEVTDTYVIQIRFPDSKEYDLYNTYFHTIYIEKLFQKFTNKFVIFSSTLEDV